MEWYCDFQKTKESLNPPYKLEDGNNVFAVMELKCEGKVGLREK